MKEGLWFCLLFFLAGCTTNDSLSDSTFSPVQNPSSGSSDGKWVRGALFSRRTGQVTVLPFEWPVRGVILSRFGDPKGDMLNKGIDIQASLGSTVRAAQGGQVSFVNEQLKGYGRVIILDHRDGYQTVYAHNSENLVRHGEFVAAKQMIARLGSGGRAAVPYLHFEVRRNHKPVDPLIYLSEAL